MEMIRSGTTGPKRFMTRLVLVAGFAAASCAGGADFKTLSPDEAGLDWFECGGGNVWPKGCEAYLVWGNYEKGASGWYIRAPAGYVFPRHFHATEERILVVRGRIAGAVDGGAETVVSPGMYWALGGNAVHWARCEDACLMYITYDGPFDLTFK